MGLAAFTLIILLARLLAGSIFIDGLPASADNISDARQPVLRYSMQARLMPTKSAIHSSGYGVTKTN